MAIYQYSITVCIYGEWRLSHFLIEDDILTRLCLNFFLRMLLLAERGGDSWTRTDELMDHLEEKCVHPQECSILTTGTLITLRKDDISKRL